MKFMKRLLLATLGGLLLVACGARHNAKSPVGATSLICEQLMAGEYDAILDRTYEWNPQQDEEQFDITKWAEQVAAQNLRTIVRAQMVSVFANEQSPVVGYKVADEQYASDSLSAKVVVRFIRQDDSILEYQFVMLRQEDGTWRSAKMYR